MRKNIPWERESLDDYTWRVAVVGGWIVYQIIYAELGCGLTSTFIADRDHEWKIKKPENEAPPAVVYEEFRGPTL